MKKNIVAIISGPTASGKTATAIALAKKFGGHIVNFDSLLFYNELNIGTAKPSLEELTSVPHHMVNTHSAKNPINAAGYLKEALPIINKLHQQNEIVYLVGGSGFYLQALLYGMYESHTTPTAILKKSDLLFKDSGIAPFIEILKTHDLDSFHLYHENDHYRIRRAVEHWWSTNTPFSQSRSEMDTRRLEGPMHKFQWNVFHAYLDFDKEKHFAIIQKRTKNILAQGLLDEMSQLLLQGFSGEEKPLCSIGYKEAQAYLAGTIATLQELEDLINIATRQLAKSQRTWFKKWDKITYDPTTQSETLFSDFEQFLKKEDI